VIDGIADFEVTNVQVFNGYVLHIGHLKYGKLSVGDSVVSSYDEVSQRYTTPALSFTPGSSSGAGHFVIITRRRTFSISPYARF